MNVVVSFSVYSFTVLLFSGNPKQCTVLPYLFFDITGIQGFSHPLEKNLHEKIVLIFNDLRGWMTGDRSAVAEAYPL